MKRTVRGAIVAVVGALMAAGLAPACVEYPQSLVVTKVVVSKPDEEGVCLYDPGTPELITGRLDVAVADSYTATLVVKNQLRAAADPARNRVESSSVYLLGATVRQTVDGVNLDAEIIPNADPKLAIDDGRTGNEYRTPGSGFVTPGGGQAIATVDLLDSAAVKKLRRLLAQQTAANPSVKSPTLTVIAFARVQGQTLGGLSIESQEFQFPITVCSKCLVSFPRAPDTANPDDKCPSPPASATGSTEKIPGTCRVGQDSAFDCLLCKSTVPYCLNKK
ncbi:MAG TPA: hypothetical protein PLR99_06895 [Polyangiaceae bacterium]|jgi:hypothetical protein|nr:hypothetical protein [Polyangiaceae bacterium]